MFLSVLKVEMAFMRPSVPIDIRSSIPMPVFSKRLAMYTTKRRFRSTSRFFAFSAASLSSLFNAAKALASFAASSGDGSTCEPLM